VRKVKLLLGVLVLVLILAPSVIAAKWNFTVGTSNLGGSFYIMGAPWAKVMTEHVPDVVATVQAALGSSSNIQLIEKGDMKLAIASAMAGYEGWNGLNWANGVKYQKFRVMFTIYSSYFQIVTLTKSNIKTVRDLEGKKIHMAMPNTTPDLAMQYILDALNIKPRDKQYMQTETAMEQLKDAKLDAVILAMGVPTSMLLDLQSTHDIRMVDISNEDAAIVSKKYPTMVKGVIKKGTYENMTGDINAFVFWNNAICTQDLPDELVYQITKAVFENKDEFVAAASYGKELAPENILGCLTQVHPGAAKYYKEIGINLPSNLISANK